MNRIPLALFLLALGLLLACGESDDASAPIEASQPCVSQSEADFCGQRCGTYKALDNCERQRTVQCGGCAKGASCQSNACVPDSGEEDCPPESDATLCGARCGTYTARDACGQQRTVACGGCAAGTFCQNNECVENAEEECTPESDELFCRERCGTYSALDNCRQQRTAQCGTCAAGYGCQSNECVQTTPPSNACAEDLSDFDGTAFSGKVQTYTYTDTQVREYELSIPIQSSDYVYISTNNSSNPASDVTTFSNQAINSGLAWSSSGGYWICQTPTCVGLSSKGTFYEAQSGQVSITSLHPSFSGSVHNAVFAPQSGEACETPAIGFSFAGTFDEAGEACSAQASYRDLSTTAYASAHGEYYDSEVLNMVFSDFIGSSSEGYDFIQVEFYNGKYYQNTGGAFSNGIRTGSYSIQGDDTDYATCTLCLSLVSNYLSSGQPGNIYRATSGQVSITAANLAGAFGASLTNVAFAGEEDATCTSLVVNASFGTTMAMSAYVE